MDQTPVFFLIKSVLWSLYYINLSPRNLFPTLFGDLKYWAVRYFLPSKNVYYEKGRKPSACDAVVVSGHGQSLSHGKCDVTYLWFIPGPIVFNSFAFPMYGEIVSGGSNLLAFCLCEDAFPHQRYKRNLLPAGIRLRNWFHDGFKPI